HSSADELQDGQCTAYRSQSCKKGNSIASLSEWRTGRTYAVRRSLTKRTAACELQKGKPFGVSLAQPLLWWRVFVLPWPPSPLARTTTMTDTVNARTITKRAYLPKSRLYGPRSNLCSQTSPPWRAKSAPCKPAMLR